MNGKHKKSFISLVTPFVISFSICFFYCNKTEASSNVNEPEKPLIFQWPLDPVTSLTLSGSNDFATYNTKQSNYYHVGIDMRSAIFEPCSEVPLGNWTEYVTPVKAAADGELAGLFSTFDTTFRCGGLRIDSSRTYLSPSETVNRGLGNVVVIRHSNGVYTLYGHLDCISPDLHIGDRVERGTVIGKMGHSTTVRRAGGVVPHLHFEVKDVRGKGPTADELLGNPIGGIYWGYTPDLPTGYGYHDPREFIHPFVSRGISPVPVRILCDRSAYLTVRTGPGKGYARLSRVKGRQEYVAYQSSNNGLELWYRIYLPSANGENSGWIAMNHTDCLGNVCAVEERAALQVEITKRAKITSSPNLSSLSVKVHDRIYDCFRNLYVWKRERFVADAVVVGPNGGSEYYRICLPDTENPYAPSDESATGWIPGDCVSVR